MLVTPEANRRNRHQALIVAVLVAWATGLLGWVFPALAAAGTESVHVLVGTATVSPAGGSDAAAVSRPLGADSS